MLPQNKDLRFPIHKIEQNEKSSQIDQIVKVNTIEFQRLRD